MSWRGRITVECDSEHCRAETIFNADDLDGSDVTDRLLEEGWQRNDGLDTCPQCLEELAAGREKGEDDGREYGHPGDALRGLE